MYILQRTLLFIVFSHICLSAINADSMGNHNFSTNSNKNETHFVSSDVSLGFVWSKFPITWCLIFNQYLIKFNVSDVLTTLRMVFDEWHRKTGIPFVFHHKCHLTYNRASTYDDAKYTNVKISFENTVHGDNFEFDGPGGILAHAFYPPIGYIHLDESENFVVNDFQHHIKEDQYSLFDVLLHEVGHTLGLRHSPPNGTLGESIMTPGYIHDLTARREVRAIDVRNVKKMYAKLFNANTTLPTTVKRQPHHSCTRKRNSTLHPNNSNVGLPQRRRQKSFIKFSTTGSPKSVNEDRPKFCSYEIKSVSVLNDSLVIFLDQNYIYDTKTNSVTTSLKFFGVNNVRSTCSVSSSINGDLS